MLSRVEKDIYKALAERGGCFTAHTYPMNFADVTGLPCRVIAEV